MVGTKFEMVFEETWLRKGEVLTTFDKVKVEILEEPTLHYNKWYWKILNFLTFKLFFNARYTYICKIKE